MFIHTAFFWVDRTLSKDQVEAFERGLKSLEKIPMLREMHWGKPSPRFNLVVDPTYSYGVTMIFDDEARHNEYLAHPIHEEFSNQHSKKFTRIVVYDYFKEMP